MYLDGNESLLMCIALRMTMYITRETLKLGRKEIAT